MSVTPLLNWHVTVTAPPLITDAVHVWRLLPDATDLPLATCQQILSPHEQQRAARLTDVMAQQRYVRIHALCRLILAQYVALPAAALMFNYTTAGKPQLVTPAVPIEFNVTTAGPLALLAVTLQQPIGVDCEYYRPRPAVIAIARRMFPPAAVAQLTALTGTAQLQAFYYYWTALEARVKCSGRGLYQRRQLAPDAIEIAHAQPNTQSICAIARRQLSPPAAWITLAWPTITEP